jgi:ribosome-binding protein aMBF1 (putative translation factor)
MGKDSKFVKTWGQSAILKVNGSKLQVCEHCGAKSAIYSKSKNSFFKIIE